MILSYPVPLILTPTIDTGQGMNAATIRSLPLTDLSL
jgi:hypothetical protein